MPDGRRTPGNYSIPHPVAEGNMTREKSLKPSPDPQRLANREAEFKS